MIFGILKDLFKSIEVLCRSVTILVGSERANFSSRWHTKKVPNTLSNFAPKNDACAIS